MFLLKTCVLRVLKEVHPLERKQYAWIISKGRGSVEDETTCLFLRKHPQYEGCNSGFMGGLYVYLQGQ